MTSTTPPHWCHSWRMERSPGDDAQQETKERERLGGGEEEKSPGDEQEQGPTCWPEEQLLGWMLRPRVTPPLRAFFSFSFTSVSSSSRFTRSSSFRLHSSSVFLQRSASEAWPRFPGRREGLVT